MTSAVRSRNVNVVAVISDKYYILNILVKTFSQEFLKLDEKKSSPKKWKSHCLKQWTYRFRFHREISNCRSFYYVVLPIVKVSLMLDDVTFAKNKKKKKKKKKKHKKYINVSFTVKNICGVLLNVIESEEYNCFFLSFLFVRIEIDQL